MRPCFPFTIQPSSLLVEPLISVSGGIASGSATVIMPAFFDTCGDTDVCVPVASSSASWETSSELKSVMDDVQYALPEKTRQMVDSVGEPVSFSQTVGSSANRTAAYALPRAVSPAHPVGTEKGLSWSPVSGAAAYRVEYIQGTACISVQTESAGLEHFGLPAGDWQWRVRAEGDEDWASGNDIHIDAPAPEPQLWQGQPDGLDELFFSRKFDTWSAAYQAQHVGILGGWEGTCEKVVLEGKNKIADIFNGTAQNTSILLLTDDANGDALFVDDIYTELPGALTEQQARIAGINEIRAGAGNDIVDLTSQRFAYIGSGVTVRGGLGDDVIWANLGDNRLFGDAGDDRLVGASGDDVLAGGSGNDSLHGGGGDDIFCFCAGWGQDTVEQLSDGKVTLWFAEGDLTHWNADTLTYTDGDNSVIVTGVSDVTLKFGSGISDMDAARYSELRSCGAFAAATSEKIFGIVTDDPGSGMEFPTGEGGENPNPLA